MIDTHQLTNAAARYVTRASAYRLAGDTDRAARCREAAIALTQAARAVQAAE